MNVHLMNRQPVASSNIRSIGFEDGAMDIEFSNGKVYRYTGPKVEAHHKGLTGASSVGSYFAQHVRNCPVTKCELVHNPAAAGNGGW